MKTLHNDDYFSVQFDEEREIIVDIWSEKSEELDAEDFQALLLSWKALVLQHNADKAITDLVHFRFPMTPDVQEWTLKNITVPLSQEGNYRKHAFIMPQEFIANLSIEQFTEENNAVAITR